MPCVAGTALGAEGADYIPRTIMSENWHSLQA